MSVMCRSGPAAAGLGCQCSGAVRRVRPMTPSPSARLPRPTGRPRVPNAGPAPVLALWPAAALAPGRVAAHVWHGQMRLGERFHLRCERSAPVTAVASARQECVQLLASSISAAGACTTCAYETTGSSGASSTRRRSAPSARLVEGLGTPPFAKTPGSTRANHRTCRPCSGQSVSLTARGPRGPAVKCWDVRRQTAPDYELYRVTPLARMATRGQSHVTSGVLHRGGPEKGVPGAPP